MSQYVLKMEITSLQKGILKRDVHLKDRTKHIGDSGRSFGEIQMFCAAYRPQI